MSPIPDRLAAPETEQPRDMGLLEHLAELRKRLLFSFIAIIAGTCICFFGAGYLFEILTYPFYQTFTGFSLIGTGPAEAFILKLKTAFFSGVILVSPFLFIQLWLFIAPGLYEHERKLAIPFVVSTTALFAIGVWFAYSIVVPYAFEFFRDEYLSIHVTPTIRISEFLSITIKILFGFGIIFETPIIAYFLGKLGIITDQFLIDYYRHAIVVMFVLAAFLTPPDVVTQFLMAGPLILLYGISILIVRYTGTDRQTKPEEQEPDSREG